MSPAAGTKDATAPPPTPPSGDAEAKKRVAPTLGIKVVDEIPAAPPAGASREFHNLLVTVANEHKGVAVEIATYQSKEGASQVRRSFLSGKRTPPGGKDAPKDATDEAREAVGAENMKHWTMEARRQGDGTSKLYVKYAEDGPDVPTDSAPADDDGDE